MRLIDADELKEKLLDVEFAGMGWYKAEKAVDKAPTIDGVPVIRCKDCEYKGWVQEPCHGRSIAFCHFWDSCIDNSEKNFCSFAKRKSVD